MGVPYLQAGRKYEMTQQQFLDEYMSLPVEAQRQVADFVAFLRQRDKATQSMPQARTANLEDEPFIGMWRNRQDLEDSTTWVRNTRKAEWGEGARPLLTQISSLTQGEAFLKRRIAWRTLKPIRH